MLLDPTLTTQPPTTAAPDAEALALEHYGKVLTAHELTGERDRNFHMVGDNGEQFLFKVVNPAEPADIVHLQNGALNHIRDFAPALPVPHPVAAGDGAYHASITLADGRATLARMLTYLPGLPLSKAPRSPAQRRALGQCLAELDIALQGFEHPAASHELLWNVSTAHRLKGMIDSIADPGRQAMVRRFMAHYEAETLPRLGGLRAQVIHNDFNLGNVLVEPDDTDSVAAIIDFGDVVHGPLVGDIATAAAYQLTDAYDPLLNAAEMIGGYDATLPLLGEERDVLADLVIARLFVTVLITGWRAERYPENRTYILRNNGPAWAGLDLFDGMSRDDARGRLLQFCSTGEF
ncbi:phosphotransferase [Croceicoccus sp. YJ47]|uniref:phosphotransferase n=1 Tax=Croceicoccus sp. YJ47 TaxID=2798724 RepID=UPI00192237BD|nr:phosphotransferase [Croceicoccus sp. YJ47]QQN74936.1 phosphotransferase [Croceicoccus sp. YJ47]